MTFQRAIDEPVAGQACYRQSIPVAGWVYCGERQSALRRIVARLAGHEIGETELFYARADVAASLGLPPGSRVAFQLLAVAPPGLAGRQEIEVVGEFADGSQEALGRTGIELLADDHTSAPYGDLCNPARTAMLHRRHLYSTGHPAPTASPECLELLASYLPSGAAVLDVGCGIGAYAQPLRDRGFAWTGCETSAGCVSELARRGLPHRHIQRGLFPWSGYRLPARDGEFDAAMAIEVLEHTRNPDEFLAQVVRVVRQRACFSVPNVETIPFLADRLVAPWHMLEGDHRNFFSRFNLAPLLRRHFRRVEVLAYGRQPLASRDGILLPYHLFAICDR